MLAVLVASSSLAREGQIALSDGWLPAGFVAFLVAWVTENMLATIAVGTALYWSVRFLS